jgi:hypothetical protein
LQTRGRVHDVARGQRFGADRDERLARVDADPKLDPLLAGPLADGKRGADCTLGIVLVCDRGAEQRHHRIADELLDRAAPALEHLSQVRVVRREEGAHVLGIHLFGARGEADQVGEEHGDDLALLPRGGRRFERHAAGAAELETLRVLLTTSGTNGHGGSVRGWRPAY